MEKKKINRFLHPHNEMDGGILPLCYCVLIVGRILCSRWSKESFPTVPLDRLLLSRNGHRWIKFARFLLNRPNFDPSMARFKLAMNGKQWQWHNHCEDRPVQDCCANFTHSPKSPPTTFFLLSSEPSSQHQSNSNNPLTNSLSLLFSWLSISLPHFPLAIW